MTDLTNAPAWVQGIAERESKATEGPWDRCEAEHCPCGNVYKNWDDGGNAFSLVSTTGCVDHEGVSLSDDVRRANADFIAHARTDIPRLIEAAAGMAEVLEQQLRDDYTDCYGGVAMMAVDCVTCQLRDDCGRSRVLKALAKWRGEAGE